MVLAPFFNAMSGCRIPPRTRLVVGTHLRVARAGFARHRPPLPAAPGVRTAADNPADASGNVLRTRAVGTFTRIILHWRRSAVSALSTRHPSRLRSLTLPPRFLCRLPPATHTARRLRRHRRTRAVRLAALVFGTPLYLRVARARFARHRPPLPAAPGVRTTADTPADASGNVLRTRAVGDFTTDHHSIGAAAPPVSTSPALPVTLPCRAAARSRTFGRWRSLRALRSPTRRRGPCAVLQRHAWLLHPSVRTARRLRRHRRTHAVRLAALAPTFSSTACRSRLPPTCARLRNGPSTTARVAEDPLRASPAPLGDTGLPPLLRAGSPSLLRLARARFARHRSPLPPCSVSATLRMPLPPLPETCFARVPSAPSALSSTQSPWRLPSVAFADVNPTSLVPFVLSFLTAFRGFGSHTPRISDAGDAIRILGPPLSAKPSPFDAAALLDRAYVAPIHAGILPLAMQGYACPTPVHGRYTLVVAANTDRHTTDMRS